MITTLTWAELSKKLANRRDDIFWQPGEHLSIIGPTQAGKTYLMLCLFPLRQYITYYVAKAQDKTLNGLTSRKHGELRFNRIADYHDRQDWNYRVLLWPKADGLEDEHNQAVKFYYALSRQFRERGWTIAIDEIAHFVDIGLTKALAAYWRRGASLKLSLMAATQRPAGVPLLMYAMPHHLFFFRYRDETDLKRIGGIGYLDRKEIKSVVSNLERYQFLYIHVPTGFMCVSKAERE
jgi:hypothetical protein